MISRIRVTGIRPGTLAEFKVVARDWKNLLEQHGGRVVGFYFNGNDNRVTGIAEYESRTRLSEIQRSSWISLFKNFFDGGINLAVRVIPAVEAPCCISDPNFVGLPFENPIAQRLAFSRGVSSRQDPYSVVLRAGACFRGPLIPQVQETENAIAFYESFEFEPAFPGTQLRRTGQAFKH